LEIGRWPVLILNKQTNIVLVSTKVLPTYLNCYHS
jgi:hypothetical protein